MADTMQTAVEVLARALAGSDQNRHMSHQAQARALLAEIAPLIRAEEREKLRVMSAAARAEFEAREACKATPTDRGGASGPKGRAFFKWIDARATLKAAVMNADGGK